MELPVLGLSADEFIHRNWLNIQIHALTCWPDDPERQVDFILARVGDSVGALEDTLRHYSDAVQGEPDEEQLSCIAPLQSGIPHYVEIIEAHGGYRRLAHSPSLEEIEKLAKKQMLAACSAGTQLIHVLAMHNSWGDTRPASLTKARGLMAQNYGIKHMPSTDTQPKRAWSTHKSVCHFGAAMVAIHGQLKRQPTIADLDRFIALATGYREQAIMLAPSSQAEGWPDENTLKPLPPDMKVTIHRFPLPTLSEMGIELVAAADAERAETKRKERQRAKAKTGG